jgi:6-phosphogluconolactonase
MSDVRICHDIDEVAHEAAGEFCRIAAEAVAARGKFFVALSGGSTPRALYELLAGDAWRGRVDWATTHVLWGDERFVPPDHPDSNYRMADEALLSKVDIPPENVHRVRTELGDPGRAAEDYERQIAELFHLPPGSAPRLDLVLLGLGDDGHTASIFPATPAPLEDWRVAVAVWVEKLHANRVTITVPVINQAAHVVFLVSGASKAHVVGEVLRGVRHTEKYPAQLVKPERGTLRWILDRPAATALMG